MLDQARHITHETARHVTTYRACRVVTQQVEFWLNLLGLTAPSPPFDNI